MMILKERFIQSSFQTNGGVKRTGDFLSMHQTICVCIYKLVLVCVCVYRCAYVFVFSCPLLSVQPLYYSLLKAKRKLSNLHDCLPNSVNIISGLESCKCCQYSCYGMWFYIYFQWLVFQHVFILYFKYIYSVTKLRYLCTILP